MLDFSRALWYVNIVMTSKLYDTLITQVRLEIFLEKHANKSKLSQ